MTEPALAPMQTWLASPLDPDVSTALHQLRKAPDVQHIAVMPDVHLAADVCIGVALATSTLIYPHAVGGDIGCGMLALAFDSTAEPLRHPTAAGQVLAALGQAVPARRRNRNRAIAPPGDLMNMALSSPTLESIRRADGAVEFATLGSGNHFIELQVDPDDRLWLMVHSGSRALGQAIRDFHLSKAEPVASKLQALDATTQPGRDYLNDAAWARLYAQASRQAIAAQVAEVLSRFTGFQPCWQTLIATDHNHVTLESHSGRQLWVHRKGAMSAQPDQPGVLPGSMGTLSFHVEGRGHPAALCSSAHGAGRKLSRTAARNAITEHQFRRQMDGIWFDSRLSSQLRDEAPSAYKDIRAVLRAQRDLVKVTRTLRPILNYKGL